MQTESNKPQFKSVTNTLIYLAFVLIAGCGQSSSDGSSSAGIAGTQDTDNTAKTISATITSNRTTIQYNGDISLDWSATNADSCIASGDWSGDKGITGSEIISSLTNDSSFVLTCSNATESTTSTLVVTVSPPSLPVISLSANPANVVVGGSTTLNWNSFDATSCTASGDWSGSKATTGSDTRNNLTSNRSYTLSCSGPGGDASATIDVTVVAPSAPIVNLSANPSSVSYDGSTTLSWTTGNVDTCNASGDWSGSKNTSGSNIRNNLTSNRTYTLTCSGSNGSASDSVTVSVGPAPVPSIDLTASPTSVPNNGSTILSWTGNNVDSCTASGDWSGSKNTSGSSSQDNLTSDKTYSLTCTGAFGSVSDSVSVSVTAAEPSDQCPAMSAPTGNIINVNPSQAGQLPGIVSSANQGDTILLADGTYNLNGGVLWFSTPGITLRSASGNPDAVILDGAYSSSEIVTMAASNLTVAEVTITRAFTHLIHVTTSSLGDTDNSLIYRVKLIDPREQAIKINSRQTGDYSDDGTIACSEIRLTDQGRPNVNPNATGCYTGGIDAHKARGWTIRDNHFEGFWCASGLSEHAVHFWRGGRDTVVERNILKDNARGIGFGLSSSGSNVRTYSDNFCPQANGAYIGHYGGIIRNNFIHASSTALFNSASGYDCGICLASACKTTVVHNSLVSTGNAFSSIEWRFAGSVDVEIHNNIVTHSLRARNGGSANLSANIENAPLALFADGQNGDLHLDINATSAIDQGISLNPGVGDRDIDNDLRDANPDIGADEY